MEKNRKKLLRDVASLTALVLVILAARSSLADHYYVPSGSMLPTIDLGDRILVNKLAYGFRVPFSNWYLVESEGPQHGDVVVFESPEDGEVLIKRVIGCPGDIVTVRGRRVAVPANKYYLLGDNRGNSHDGRMFGLVDRSAILGRAVGIFLGREGFSWKPL
jgi:signal peptidase I